MNQFVLALSVTNIFLFKVAISATYNFDELITTNNFHNYDMLVLSQMWPQSACWNLNHAWERQDCNFCNYVPKASGNDWILHGLWPSNRTGRHPSFCDRAKKFDSTLLDYRLIEKLSSNSPSLNKRSNNTIFWKHEWDKHGTCASNVEGLNSVPRYFSKAIELLDTYNMREVLKLFGIIPTMVYEYNVEDIVLAVETFLQHRVSIICAKNKVNQKNYLYEIRICFDKSFEVIDCDVKSVIKCRGSHLVIYPEILKSCN